MATASRNHTNIIAGLAFNNADSLTADGELAVNPTLAAAKVGALTTRTDANTGELTMAASHGITTGVRLDVYWSGGSRYGMTVGTVATNQVPIDGGAGDDLPADETAITAMIPVEETFDLVGNDATAIGAAGDAAFTVVFVDGSDAAHLAVAKYAAGGYSWLTGDGTNPIAGDTITDVFLSHGSSSGAVNVRAAALRNS